MLLVIDNTQRQKVKMFLPKLLAFLDTQGTKYTIVKGDTTGIGCIQAIKAMKGVNATKGIKAIIMTGSPLMLSSSSPTEYATNTYCLKHFPMVPTLGICFGCQLINTYFGGTLRDLGTLYCDRGTTPSAPLRPKFCCRYVPDVVPSPFKVEIECMVLGKKTPCIIKHKRRPLTGIMFHPEALKSTHYILEEFCKSI